MSTSLNPIGAVSAETRNQAVARRLRGQIAEHRISASAIARAIGMTQAMMSRRTTGLTEMTVTEIDLICQVTGFDFDWLVTGTGTPKPPGGPNGPGGLLCAIRDLNPEPADLDCAQILAFPPADQRDSELQRAA